MSKSMLAAVLFLLVAVVCGQLLPAVKIGTIGLPPKGQTPTSDLVNLANKCVNWRIVYVEITAPVGQSICGVFSSYNCTHEDGGFTQEDGEPIGGVDCAQTYIARITTLSSGYFASINGTNSLPAPPTYLQTIGLQGTNYFLVNSSTYVPVNQQWMLGDQSVATLSTFGRWSAPPNYAISHFAVYLTATYGNVQAIDIYALPFTP